MCTLTAINDSENIDAKTNKLSVVIIGSGNVATHLSFLLQHAGHSIIQVFSKTKENAEILAKKIQCPSYTCIKEDIAKNADIYIISVSDKALPDICKIATQINNEALWIHTSGCMDIQTIKSSRSGVLYPLQTFSKSKALSTPDIPFFIEANNEKDKQRLIDIARSLSKNVHLADSKTRRQIHLAAVFCNNFSNHCFALADTILSEHHIPFDVMLPLINETVDKLKIMNPKDAQTGPAVRHDTNVMNKHISMLDENNYVCDIYELMSKSIHKMHSQTCNTIQNNNYDKL